MPTTKLSFAICGDCPTQGYGYLIPTSASPSIFRMVYTDFGIAFDFCFAFDFGFAFDRPTDYLNIDP